MRGPVPGDEHRVTGAAKAARATVGAGGALGPDGTGDISVLRKILEGVAADLNPEG